MTHLFRLKADLLKDEKKFESEELLEDLEENLKEPEDEDEESEEVEPESEVQQSFPSERTDRRQLSGVFTKVEWSEGVVNFDNGGGASDKAQEYLDKFGATNLVYDPYNRTNGHNLSLIHI